MVGFVAAGLVLGSGACQGTGPEPPSAEFIVATPDSTYWVRSGGDGIHVRAVPMTVTQYDHRFREVYVADVDRSFNDAVFAGERVYVRDLVSGDSTLVYDDSFVVNLAAHHARVHPEAARLGPDDEAPTNPEFIATGETDIIAVRGPYALIEHRSGFEHIGGEQYDTVRAAIDLRTGRTVPVADLVRDDLAAGESALALASPREWKRPRYTLLARGDTGRGSLSLALHDPAGRSWPLFTVSTRARLYWLDSPPLDTASRRALAHAFNEAASYDQSVSFVRFSPHELHGAAPGRERGFLHVLAPAPSLAPSPAHTARMTAAHHMPAPASARTQSLG